MWYICYDMKGEFPPIERFGLREWRAVVLTNEVHGHLGIYSSLGVKVTSVEFLPNLVPVEDEAAQARLVQQILKDQLSVRQTETLVKKTIEGTQNRKSKVKITLSDEVRAAQTAISRKIGARIGITKDISGKGRIQIPFGSDDELKHILDLLQ